jgi:hypothetical protein
VEASFFGQARFVQAIYQMIDVFVDKVAALPEYCAACPTGIKP